jgi:hypothetical protein
MGYSISEPNDLILTDLPSKSSQVKSSQVKSSQVKSSQVKSSQVKSSQVKSSQVKSSHLRLLVDVTFILLAVTILVAPSLVRGKGYWTMVNPAGDIVFEICGKGSSEDSLSVRDIISMKAFGIDSVIDKSPDRNALGDEVIEALECLKYWWRKELITPNGV